VNEDRASRYHRLRRRAVIASTAAGAAWLIVLIVTGAAPAIARTTSALTASLPTPFGAGAAIVLFVVIVAAGYEAVTLPFTFLRSFLLERKYGLSSEPFRAWAADHLKALALGGMLTAGAALVVSLAIVVAGPWWWLSAAGVFTCVAVALANLAPVILMPLFYRFKPLEREVLRQRLLTLSDRAGVKVLGAFEWGLGEKTSRANAALVGLGRTRRILVSDTLLKDYSDDEIEVILAHEIAHHVHYDIWSGLAIESAALALSLLAADVAVRALGAWFGIAGVADPAALSVIALAGGLVSMLLTPVANAWSRHNERRADRFALALTHRPTAFISAMRRLAAQNLAEERPSSAVFWFFHTHPTIEERIAAAREFRPA
jgi:Zn-dependent protease with chaperone function